MVQNEWDFLFNISNEKRFSVEIPKVKAIEPEKQKPAKKQTNTVFRVLPLTKTSLTVLATEFCSTSLAFCVWESIMIGQMKSKRFSIKHPLPKYDLIFLSPQKHPTLVTCISLFSKRRKTGSHKLLSARVCSEKQNSLRHSLSCKFWKSVRWV